MEMNAFYDDEDHYEYVGDVIKKPENSTISHHTPSPQTSRGNTRGCSKKLVTVTIVFLALVAAVVGLSALTVISYIEVRSIQAQNQMINEMLEDLYQFQQSTEIALNQSQLIFSNLSNTTIPQLSADVEQTDRKITELMVALENNSTNVLAPLTAQLESVQSSMNILNTTTLDQLNSLKSLVNTLNLTSMDQLSDLQSSLSTLDTTTMNQLNSLQSSVNMLNATTMDQLSHFQSSVNAVNSAQISAAGQLSTLSSSVNTVNITVMVRLNSLQSSVDVLTTAQDSTNTQVSSLQSSLNTLTSQINSSVDLYQGCIQENSSCTVATYWRSDIYWGNCSTSAVTLNVSVW